MADFFKAVWSGVASLLIVSAGCAIFFFGGFIFTAVIAIGGIILLVCVVAAGIHDGLTHKDPDNKL